MKNKRPVTQEWTWELPMMQQSVLLTAIRGPDGLPKYGCVKLLLRWLRRCILLSAMDGKTLSTPYEDGGGSFTGNSIPMILGEREECNWFPAMDEIVSEYIRTLDAVPHHFQMHLLHAAQILGYKHPVKEINTWWEGTYERLVNDMHLHPETEEEMDQRLGDSREGWLMRADPSTIA